MVREHRLSVSRACRAAKLSRAAYYRQGVDWAKRDAPDVDALNVIVDKHRRWGSWKCFDRLHNQGHWWNPKRVYRVYCRLGLNLPRRAKKRLPLRLRQPLSAPAVVNHVWALDFMSDALWSGRRFRVLNVLDEGVREGLAIEIDTSLPAKRVVRVLERLAEFRGFPAALRMDNGPELIAQELLDWCERNRVPASRIRTPTSSATTGAFATKCSMPTCSTVSSKCVRSALDGFGSTTRKGHMMRSEDSLRPSSERL
jgi:putative transposase